jgi:hypothetical protein
MWQAGTTHGVPPLRLSLQGTRHHFDNFIPLLVIVQGVQSCVGNKEGVG